MAKNAAIFEGNATGKLGDVVLSVNHGVQNARVYRPNNSSKGKGATYAQRDNRCNIASLGRFYSSCEQLFKGAFMLNSGSISDFNQFVRLNSKVNGVRIPKDEVAAGAAVVSPVYVSYGSLPDLSCLYDSETGAYYTTLNLGTGVTPDTTVSDLTKVILANNSGWLNNDMITVVLFDEHMVRGGNDYAVPKFKISAVQFTLDHSNTNAVSAEFANLVGDYDEAKGGSLINFHGAGVTVIHSRKTGGELQVSTSQVNCGGSVLYPKYSSKTNAKVAAESYGYKDDPILMPAVAANGTAPDTPSGTTADIVSVTLNGTPVSNGSAVSTTGTGELVITGTGLAGNIRVSADGETWAPQSQSDTRCVYGVNKTTAVTVTNLSTAASITFNVSYTAPTADTPVVTGVKVGTTNIDVGTSAGTLNASQQVTVSGTNLGSVTTDMVVCNSTYANVSGFVNHDSVIEFQLNITGKSSTLSSVVLQLAGAGITLFTFTNPDDDNSNGFG